jgi:SAM-dependent methyltransferase
VEWAMKDDVSDIKAYYSNDPAAEQSRLERHQLEFELTWRYLDHYLPAQGAFLEVGAATGAYTLALARRGYQVTAVDMTPALLALNREALAQENLLAQVRLVQADARDLDPIGDHLFDAALLMGPLYHLTVEADRLEALRQIRDRLFGGGLIFSTFISRYGILGDLMKKVPEWIEDQDKVRSFLAAGNAGKRPEGYPAGTFRGYFATVEEIAPLHESVGFETLTVAAVEPAISADDDSYNQLQGERRRLWLDLLVEVSTVPSILGASRHLLYVGRKPGA